MSRSWSTLGDATMASGTPRRAKAQRAPSDEVLIATLRNKYAWALTVRYVAIILSLGALLRLAAPLAHEIAGKDTNFNVNISLALTALLSVTTAAGYGYAAQQRARARHLETRNAQLDRRIEELRERLNSGSAQAVQNPPS
jgi:hypothetical protein